jgi:hypothetical protein
VSKHKKYYGYCPRCDAPVKSRERRPNGNDVCLNDHCFPSAYTLDAPAKKATQLAESTIQSQREAIAELVEALRSADDTILDLVAAARSTLRNAQSVIEQGGQARKRI